MNRAWIAGLLIAGTCSAHAALPLPSDVMRRIPSIPDPVHAADCAAAEPVLAEMVPLARAEMMRAQRMAMAGGRGGRVNDAQGELIAKLSDPRVTLCDAKAYQELNDRDARDEFREALDAIDMEMRREITSRCPVIGSADYRDEKCVDPIVRRGLQAEHAAVSNYIVTANAALAAMIDAYAQCSAKREALAAEAGKAELPPQYASMAFNGKAKGWQQVGALADRYRQFCEPAADAMADIANRERGFQPALPVTPAEEQERGTSR